MDELGRMSVEDFKNVEKLPLMVVLDNIRSLSNIGSIFRTSDAFRVAGIQLCGITAKPPHRDIQKTALGATESVDWAYHATTLECIQNLQAEGWTVLAIEQAEKTTELRDFEVTSEGKYAIVLGHEVTGVDQAVIDACDGCIELAQHGTKHSLNVSVCGSIVIWEFFGKLS